MRLMHLNYSHLFLYKLFYFFADTELLARSESLFLIWKSDDCHNTLSINKVKTLLINSELAEE